MEGSMTEMVNKHAVDVEWPGHHERGLLTTDHPQSSYGIPVLVIGGIAHGIADLPPGCVVRVVWKKTRTGPVWVLIQKAIDAGYPIEVDPVG
jgi:hypothetical protein